MNSDVPKKIGSSGSAFQQLPKSASNGKIKKTSSASENGHAVENLSGPSLLKVASTTSLRSGATTAAETTPLSSHKIQLSVSSTSLQETDSNSRTSSSEDDSNKPTEAKSATIFSPAYRALYRESIIHEGFRTFLREEMGSVLKYRFELQKAQTACQDFLKEAGQKLILAHEAEDNALSHELFQEAQTLSNKAMITANKAFQDQQTLEATFPPEILAQLMAH